MTTSSTSMLQMILPFLLLFAAMWFFLIRPQSKKDKETRKMRNELAPGDEITTIGGIVGTVLNIKEDSVIVYCGADKIKLEFKKWAIGEVTKKKNDPKKDVQKDSSKAAEADREDEKKTEEKSPKFRKLERKEEE